MVNSWVCHHTCKIKQWISYKPNYLLMHILKYVKQVTESLVHLLALSFLPLTRSTSQTCLGLSAHLCRRELIWSQSFKTHLCPSDSQIQIWNPHFSDDCFYPGVSRSQQELPTGHPLSLLTHHVLNLLPALSLWLPRLHSLPPQEYNFHFFLGTGVHGIKNFECVHFRQIPLKSKSGPASLLLFAFRLEWGSTVVPQQHCGQCRWEPRDGGQGVRRARWVQETELGGQAPTFTEENKPGVLKSPLVLGFYAQR